MDYGFKKCDLEIKKLAKGLNFKENITLLKYRFWDLQEYLTGKSIKDIYMDLLNKTCPNCKDWQKHYDKLLEDYCTVMFEVTGGILSYKHYRPEDILMLDTERVNKLCLEFLVDELESMLDIMNEKGNNPKDTIKKIIKEARKNLER
jgi:hypothetical protein